jgi:hypothetical protein
VVRWLERFGKPAIEERRPLARELAAWARSGQV